MNWCCVIPGGGGKTTLSLKFPTLFLDIDEFMWGLHREKLLIYIRTNNINNISKLYEYEMKNNAELREDHRVILTHYPENATWLNRQIIAIFRPTKGLHERNIRSRTIICKNLARNDWHNLTPYKFIQYPNFRKLERDILRKTKEVFTKVVEEVKE